MARASSARICAGQALRDDMRTHLTIFELTILAGTAVAIAAILIVLVYGLHKALRRQLHDGEFKPPTPRAEDSTAFALAAMQGVIADLKTQLEQAWELQRATAKQVQENARLMEILLQEMGQGLMVFDREGFVSMANPAARALLGVDTWSRRRYPNLLGTRSVLAALVRDCLETAKPTKQERIEFQTPSGEVRSLVVSVLPLQGRDQVIEGAVCLLSNLGERTPGD